MTVLNDFVQEIVIAGGYCCFWVGPSRSDAQLCSLRLYGTVSEAGNNATAVSLLTTAELCHLKISVTIDDASNRITKVTCKETSIDVSSIADDTPYAARNHNHGDMYALAGHNHDGRYALLAHNHDGVYSPVGHNHDAAYAAIGHNHDAAYAAIGHNHDHNLLNNRLPREHTLAIQTLLVRAVPLGTPLRELLLSDAEFAALSTELGGSPLAAYGTRNGMSSVVAMVVDGGVIQRVLAAVMVQNAAAADLRWDLRLYYTGSEAEYTRPFGGSTENVYMFVTTHLNAN